MVFLVANTTDYPFVLGIVSPSYVKGMAGIESLKSGNDLSPGMAGFKEIAIPLSKRLLNSETGKAVKPCEILLIKAPTGSSLGFYTSGTRTTTKVKAECSNGTPINTTLEALLKNVQKLKNRNLKWLSLILFALGVIISIVGYLIAKK